MQSKGEEMSVISLLLVGVIGIILLVAIAIVIVALVSNKKDD
jgi:hypothetical protein